jgi:hypothetical protein
MNRGVAMSRLVICVSLLAATGCTTTPVKLAGPYASRLSHADVRQITALVVESDFYDHGYTTLEAVRPDQVRVIYTGYSGSRPDGTVSGIGSTYFTAVRDNGRWIQQGLLDTRSRRTPR